MHAAEIDLFFGRAMPGSIAIWWHALETFHDLWLCWTLKVQGIRDYHIAIHDNKLEFIYEYDLSNI